MEANWLSLLPSLLAIIFAIVTRRVLLALIGGIILANILLFWPQPMAIAEQSLVAAWQSLSDANNVLVWFFTLGIGALFGVLERGGTFSHFVMALERRQWVDSPRRARLFTWIMGVVVFIESNVTIMIAGTTSRPVYDRLRIAREKLAYIVDSTCAPICILIPLNAWGAFNLTIIGNQGVSDPLGTFITSLGFSFYAIFAVLLALLVAWFDWNLGPMKAAERRAKHGQVEVKQQQPSSEAGYHSSAANGTGAVWVVVASLVSMVVLVPLLLLWTGDGVLTQGDGTLSVFLAIYSALAIALVGTYWTLNRGAWALLKDAVAGARKILPLAVILWLSITLGDMTKALQTGQYLASILDQSVSLWALLPLIFIISGLTGFSIGSSWGTFAIMLPLAIPLALSLGLPP
ncbi:Na+/H+ antiporter NhaC family protein, partial [Idiomarina xiamenensis]